ncbi:MAG TPA: alpha/beta hydrolase, partial [Micromonospora sp.]
MSFLGKPGVKRTAGLIGAAAGVVAAGVAAGIAAERAVVRRSKRATDPYADEVFGQHPHNRSFTLEMADGTDIHVEVVETSGPAAPAAVPEPGGGATATGRPTVVFVHGFCLDRGTYHFQRTVLTERGDLRMVFYDQPGHGRSGRLRSGEYRLERLGETLKAVIDATVPEGPLVLVGHSMGGMTIMAFAERYPELFGDRVVGTVLIATSGGRLDEAQLGLPAILARTGSPLFFLVGNATRLTGGVIDRARRASSNVAWLLTRRYGFGTDRPSPALVS